MYLLLLLLKHLDEGVRNRFKTYHQNYLRKLCIEAQF